MFRNRRFYFVFVLAAHTLAKGDPQKISFSGIKQLEDRGASVSALAVNLGNGQTYASYKSGKRLTPASVSKLVLGANILEKYGSDFQFLTNLYVRGTVKGDTLFGDLVFEGSGDPSLTNEKLWFLTSDVARLGIKKVTGDLVINTALFGDVKRDLNRQVGRMSSSHAYDSPLSAAAVNFSVVAAVASAGDEPGKKGSVGLEPYAMEGFKVKGSVNTSRAGAPQVSASRRRVGGVDEIQVSGQIPVGTPPVRIYRSVSDADEYTGSTVRAFLTSNGTVIRGRTRVERVSRKATDRLLTRIEGYPLDWQIKGLMKMSNNFIADMFTLQLDVDPESPNGAQLSAGAKKLEEYMRDALKEARLLPPEKLLGELVLESGSGLTPENRLSAYDVVTILDRMYQNMREFPAFLSSLPIAGSEGTLRKRFQKGSSKHLQEMLRAKTGTLSEPRDAVALAGYCRLGNDWIAFAVIVNGTEKLPSPGVAKIREIIDNDIAALFPLEN